MPVGHFDLTGAWEIRQGFAYSVRFTFPTDISLDGYTAQAQIRRGPRAADPPYADTTPLIAQDDDDLWYVQFDLTDAETAAMPSWNQAEYEIALTSGGGSTDLGFEGKVDIKPGLIA